MSAAAAGASEAAGVRTDDLPEEVHDALQAEANARARLEEAERDVKRRSERVAAALLAAGLSAADAAARFKRERLCEHCWACACDCSGCVEANTEGCTCDLMSSSDDEGADDSD
jgi:hypothetical protein